MEYKAVGKDWVAATQGQRVRFNDQLRTGLARALLRLDDLSRLEIGTNSIFEFLPPAPQTKSSFSLSAGLARLFTRNKPGEVQFRTSQTAGGNRGTELNIEVDPVTGRTVLTVGEGEAEVTRFGEIRTNLVISAGKQAIFETNRQPLVVEGREIVQWWLFYPAVLNSDELNFSAAEKADLTESLDAYRKGNLLRALESYPKDRIPQSKADRVFLAAVLLAVGQVERTEEMLEQVNAEDPHAEALRRMIAAVNLRPFDDSTRPILASEWLAQSYYEQSLSVVSRDALSKALAAAQQAVSNAPNFGFALERLAELEFSFGRTAKAWQYLDGALKVSPENPQAHALKGFLFAARNRVGEALDSFDQAIWLDGSLGNAWLGRGLCLIRQGKAQEGRADLQTAAALEPNRSLLRSYLGKAFSNAKDDERARRELERARTLDENDPTPWLYLALLDREGNRINTAVGELEKSLELNNNRHIYRSELLLDQDRAVRSSSLANLYQSAGMGDVSVREAARGVSYDYANYSAHLFLSDSFNALRDPTRFNLRYETPWFNELLLANLLSPVGGTPLSQNISQQEYSRMFERDRVGLSSSTEYRSDGQVRELASQYGNIGNTGWALDLDYQHNDGIRPNNDLDRIEWYSTIKQQLTAKDSVMLLTKYQDYHSGDNFQYYDPANARPNFRFDEFQSPIAIGGYHHEWSPGVHTLLLGGRLENDQRFSDLGAFQTLIHRPGLISDYDNLDVQLRSKLEIYSIEAQQIVESTAQTLVLGARWQGGDFETHALMTNPTFYNGDTNLNGVFQSPPADTNVVADYERITGYVYETLKLPGRLNVTAGLAVEQMRFPENFRSPPIQSGEDARNRLNPKASIVWDASPQVSVRGVYAKSLGGVSLDESYRLEPTQLAGFSQAFRTVIPESLVGSVSAPDHEIWGAALDLKFPTRTYVGLNGQRLHSEVRQTAGIFDLLVGQPFPNIMPSGTRQHLNYEEHAFNATLNQLLSEEWGVGAQYSFARSALKTSQPDLATALPANDLHADLHRTDVYLLFNHPSGFFARADWDFYFQNRSRAVVDPFTVSDVPNETLHQINFLIGYRFPRQRGDLTFGVLNVTGEDYRLNPVTPYAELPRKAVFYARLRFRF